MHADEQIKRVSTPHQHESQPNSVCLWTLRSLFDPPHPNAAKFVEITMILIRQIVDEVGLIKADDIQRLNTLLIGSQTNAGVTSAVNPPATSFPTSSTSSAAMTE